MALYLIAFNDEWVPDLTLEEVRERGTSARAVIEEMTAAGVFVFSDGGLDASTAVCSVDPSSGTPLFTDGPFVESKEHLGGFAVVDVADEQAARYWAGRIGARGLAGLLDVQRHRVHQMHPVPAAGQRRGIRARPAAHIQHPGRRRWQQPLQQFQRSDELQRRPATGEQAVTLVTGAVMAFDRRINHRYRLPRITRKGY